MGQKGTLRAIQAAERRFQREAQKRRRELERQAKEKEKLTAIGQARLEVETFENQLEVLLSIHKEPCDVWDWLGLATALPPLAPRKSSNHELRAREIATVASPTNREAGKSAIQQGRLLDEEEYQSASKSGAAEVIETERLRALAVRILLCDHMAFIEAFAEFNPVAEFSNVGSLKQFAVESDQLISCVFKVNADEVIPSEVKALTTTGKVSVKPMPRQRYFEIYQDYVCGCTLRMAREVFAMLPVEMLLVTAVSESRDAQSGQHSEQAVLSVAMPRAKIAAINFDNLSPGEAVNQFAHRGDFSASRKAGGFQPIIPLTPADIQNTPLVDADFTQIIERVQGARAQLRAEMQRLGAVAKPDTN